MAKITEQMIREAAYFLWEKAGRPDGSAEEFWTRACVQLCAKKLDKKCSKKKPVKKK